MVLPVSLQKLVVYFLQGNRLGNLAGILRDLLDPQKKGSTISEFQEKFGAFYVRARKKSFVQTSFCRRATRRPPDYSSNLCPPKTNICYMTFLRAVLGLLPVVFLYKTPKTAPKKVI